MTLDTFQQSTTHTGTQIVVVPYPGELKIQTTGPGATVLLQAGPPSGKSWTVSVSIHIKEV